MKSDYIKPSVYNRIYSYMQYENALCLRLCLETGLRVGDALKVRAEDIRGRTLHFTAEKTGKAGKKVISKKLAGELLRLAGGSGYCFKGRGGSDRHRTRQTVWKDVKKAARAAGLSENVCPHSTRKTYAVNVFHEKGIQAAEDELQHDRLETTMLYAFSDLLTRSAADKVASPATLSDDVENLVYRACMRALRDFFKNSEFTNSGK